MPVRVLHLPMAFNDARTNAAIQKYMRSSRSEGPYLPSNVDFVAANNGLTSGASDVAKVVFSASYMVLGLGDVYLGAPCAVPVDPRCAADASVMHACGSPTPGRSCWCYVALLFLSISS